MDFSQFADYHMHTPLCRHANGEPIEYAKFAFETGLSEIGFSDHSPAKEDDFDDWRMLISEFPEYIKSVQTAKSGVPEISVKLGLEIDYFEKDHAWIEQLSSMADFDYLIGSVHYIAPGFAIDHPKWIGKWASVAEAEEIWTCYWQIYTSCARSGLFDLLAHPDLPKKFGYKPEGDLRRFYEPVIQAALETDTAIEINTAGWRKECAEQYPERDFLEMMHSAGLPISISSDAHAPEDVGMHFKEAASLISEIGFTHTVRFQNRIRTEMPFSI
jgi:histidinol-phosphatase (PHP family)